jgi:hypothetical protein
VLVVGGAVVVVELEGLVLDPPDSEGLRVVVVVELEGLVLDPLDSDCLRVVVVDAGTLAIPDFPRR